MATKKQAEKSTPTPTVLVEYDCGIKGKRRTKGFMDSDEAKKFVNAKRKAGKNPSVLKTNRKDGRAKITEPIKRAVPGVRPMGTRPYLAGTIIAKHGLVAGVTDAMVAELDEAYGKPNPTESQFCLKNAWHSSRGYIGVAEDVVA